MNNTPERIILILSELKNKYDIFSIKAEFEAEGTTYSEVIALKEILDDLGLSLTLKIGGCGAINDLYIAKEIGAQAIIAPMIETPYALKKFLSSVNKVYSNEEFEKTRFLINIETIEGFNNFDKICSSSSYNDIQGVVFGRTDFVQSLELNKESIDSNLVFKYVKDVSDRVKLNNKIFVLGGGISFDTTDFISNLQYVDFVETRKIVFRSNCFRDKNKAKHAVSLAHEFEALWIKNKCLFGGIAYKDDDKRIELLKSAK